MNTVSPKGKERQNSKKNGKWFKTLKSFFLFFSFPIHFLMTFIATRVELLPKAHRKYLKVNVTQWCPILCDPMDCTVHVILQARILERVAFPSSRGSSQPRDQTQVFDQTHIVGAFFISWATREAQEILETCFKTNQNEPVTQALAYHFFFQQNSWITILFFT